MWSHLPGRAPSTSKTPRTSPSGETLAARRLRRAPSGHAARRPRVVKLQDRWHKPFLVDFPHVPVSKGSVSDERLRTYLDGKTTSAS